MTISSTTNRVTYSGNGVTTAFSFPYYFLEDADLVVYLRDGTTFAETLQTLTTHYTVSGEGTQSGGTVTFLSAPASGKTVVIYRANAIKQDLDLRDDDATPAEDLEERLDKLTMISQRLSERADRAVRLTDGQTATFDPQLPVDIVANGAGTVPVINDDGDGWADASDWISAQDVADAEQNALDAAASAAAALTSETNAASSAAAAATSATAAATSATAAATSATAAATSAASAASAVATHAALTTTHGVAGNLVGTSDSQTLTNKTIDAASNTLSNIDNAAIKAAAGIARSKLASGNNYRILANNSSGVMSENAALTAKTVIIADANGQLTGIAPGTANNVLKSDGTDWTSGAVSAPNLAVASKTTTYTATSADDIILCSASGGAWTLTLPAAASNSGKVYRIVRTDNTPANALTIDGNASETIQGSTTRALYLQNEAVTIACDGSNWQVLEHRIPSDMVSYTPTLTGVGTASNVTGFWQRIGDSVYCEVTFTSGTAAASLFSVTLPASAVIDSAKLGIGNTTAASGPNVGDWTVNQAADLRGTMVTATGTSTSLVYWGANNSSANQLIPVNGSDNIGNSKVCALKFKVPVSGWWG